MASHPTSAQRLNRIRVPTLSTRTRWIDFLYSMQTISAPSPDFLTPMPLERPARRSLSTELRQMGLALQPQQSAASKSTTILIQHYMHGPAERVSNSQPNRARPNFMDQPRFFIAIRSLTRLNPLQP